MTQDRLRIEETAAWVNRIAQPAIDTEAGAAFDRWMEADARHGTGFADMQALWQSDTLTQALRSSVAADQQAHAPPPKLSFWKRRAPRYGLAACAASLLVALSAPVLLTTTYRGGLGAGRTIALADGSRVDLSGDAVLRVRILPWRRDAMLAQGAAFFDVHHENDRPFFVESGSTTVRVLGTAFNVDRQGPDRTVVDVYRGAVALESAHAEMAVLRKGEGARVVNDRLAAKPAIFDLAQHRRPDWQSGWFEAVDVPMGVLVAKIQPYAGRSIRFSDAALADRPVSGRFRVSEPDRVLQAIRTAYGVEVRSDREEIFLASNPASPPAPH